MHHHRRHFSKWKAFRKGIGPAIGAYFAAHMAGVDLAVILADPEKQIPVIASTLLAGLIPVIINTWKHRGAAGNPLPMLSVLIALAASVLAVQGCTTTTHPDGTVVQSIDLETAWAAYERLQDERARLEAERDAAEAHERARLDAEIARVAAEVRAAWEEVLSRYE